MSHGDFRRVFPHVVEGEALQWLPDGVRVGAGPRCLRIRLGPQSERRIGLLRVPSMEVRFDFDGFRREEVERFMRRFHRHFQRGGG